MTNTAGRVNGVPPIMARYTPVLGIIFNGAQGCGLRYSSSLNYLLNAHGA